MGDRIPLIFGAGLDRGTGVLATDPAAMHDIRNVYLADGRFQLRRGLHLTAQPVVATVAASDICGGSALRAAQLGVIAAYDRAARKVGVSIVGATGLAPQEVGVWTAALGAAAGTPRVLGCESYRKVFLAHDEPNFLVRMGSIYFDPTTGGVGSLVPLYADATTGEITTTVSAKPVKFRGVQRWLNYVLGWGYGTPVGAGNEDAPETLRISMPGEPAHFQPEHYFRVGGRGEPIVAGMVTQRDFLIAKSTELYKLNGYDRATFGVEPVDPTFGIAGANLWASVGAQCFFWSLEGPRVSEGGPSEDLGIPLDLGGEEPASLPLMGNLADGCCYYDPAEKEIVWVFGKRAYVLHLKGQSPKWSYRPLGVEARCAITLFSGLAVPASGSGGAPTGYPALDTLTATSNTLTYKVTNTAGAGVIYGDEILEVWLKVGAGAWMLVDEHDTLGVAGVQNTFMLTSYHGVVPSTSHDVAVRYRRSGLYTASPVYAGSTPAAWDATALGNSKKTVVTLAPPGMVTAFHATPVT